MKYPFNLAQVILNSQDRMFIDIHVDQYDEVIPRRLFIQDCEDGWVNDRVCLCSQLFEQGKALLWAFSSKLERRT